LPDGADFRTQYCEKCRQRHRLETWKRARRKSYKKHRDKILTEKKEEYQWYKDHGICVDCHAKDVEVRNGVQMTRCKECFERKNLLRQKKKA